MKDLKDTCRVAVVQAAPVMFDKAACTDKAVSLIREAAANGAELIVFPELFVPGYPYGMTFGYTVGHREEDGRADWKLYYDNSILAAGRESEALAAAAREAGAWVSIGISERAENTATLYNSNFIFSPEGTLVSRHRKLKPTGAERLVWGDAPDSYFPVAETPWGNVGCLICWESYMPLARVALYEKGVTIYISANTNGTSPSKATAGSSTPTCSSRAPCTRPVCTAPARSRRCRRPSAAAAAASSIRSDITRPSRCGTKRRSSTPTSTCRKSPPAAWSSTPAATTPAPTCSTCA